MTQIKCIIFPLIYQVVKKSLITFVNKHLNKLNLEVRFKFYCFQYSITTNIFQKVNIMKQKIILIIKENIKTALVFFLFKDNLELILNQINFCQVNDLESQFADGVYLCLLAGLLEGYFVPLYDFHLTPQVCKLQSFGGRFEKCRPMMCILYIYQLTGLFEGYSVPFYEYYLTPQVCKLCLLVAFMNMPACWTSIVHLMLGGLFEGYSVPLHDFHLTPLVCKLCVQAAILKNVVP